MRICNKCKAEKDEYYFNKNQSMCNECQKIYNRQWKADNIEHVKQYKKQYNEENEEEVQEYNRQYQQKYRVNKREELRIKANAREMVRKKTDLTFKIKKRVSNSIYIALHKVGSSKNGQSTFKYLSYTPKELKNYLELLFEPWMSWENWRKYDHKTWNEADQSTWTWNLDHIAPQDWFLYTSMEDELFKECWALDNLRPYNAKKNIEEQSNRSEEEIVKIKSDIKEHLEKLGYQNLTGATKE